MKSSSVTIVMYHYVRDLRQTAYPRIQGLDVSFFRQQLGYFKKYYDFVTMQDVLKCLRGEGGMRQDSILLTFDDGYKDHFEFVFPILDELGLQGSFFPSGKAIQEQIVLDVNKIHFIIEVMKEPRAIIRDIRALMDLHREQYRLFSFESYYKTLAKADHLDTAEIVFIKLLLQKVLPERLRKSIVDELFTKYVSDDEVEFSRELYMSVDQLKYLSKHGMYIGSHGWNHVWLDTLLEKQQENEVVLALQFLQNIGADVNEWVMCYPYGAQNSSLRSLLQRYGCRLGLTTESAIANLTIQDPFVLPRFDTNDFPKDENAKPNTGTLQVLT